MPRTRSVLSQSLATSRNVPVVWCLLALTALPAQAQTTAPAPAAEIDPAQYQLTLTPTPAPTSIDEELLEAKTPHAGILKYGPVSLIDPYWKKMNAELDKVGLKIGFAYTALFMAATEGKGKRTAAGGDVDLFGNWRLLGQKDGDYNGLLYFAAENRHDLGTGIAPNGLTSQIGSDWGVTNAFGEQGLTFKELYWQQHFAKDLVVFRIGKLDAENYYNSNFWQSDNLYFLNQAFSSFPVRAFPSNGLGVNLTIKPNDLFYISMGAQDAQGKKTTAGFDTIHDLNFFEALEIGLTPNIPSLGKGTYRLTGWYRDAGKSDGKPHDAGVDISIDQHIGPNLIPFFRWGIGQANINGLEHMISTGIGWQGKLLTENDVLGFAAAWGRPNDHNLRDQFAGELFYRLQVSPDNQWTIGYQVVAHPSNNPEADLIGILELRWRISF